jgi:hypothetical protein
MDRERERHGWLIDSNSEENAFLKSHRIGLVSFASNDAHSGQALKLIKSINPDHYPERKNDLTAGVQLATSAAGS